MLRVLQHRKFEYRKEVPDHRAAGMGMDPSNEVLLATPVGVLRGAVGTPESFSAENIGFG
jgi:hypothetical protein